MNFTAITVQDARMTLGTFAARMSDAQVGSVLYTLRTICNKTIDSVVLQNVGTCGTASI